MSACGVVELGELVARHGPGFDLGQLQQLLTRGCPGATADHWSERCNVRYPQLSKLGTGIGSRSGLVSVPSSQPTAEGGHGTSGQM